MAHLKHISNANSICDITGDILQIFITDMPSSVTKLNQPSTKFQELNTCLQHCN